MTFAALTVASAPTSTSTRPAARGPRLVALLDERGQGLGPFEVATADALAEARALGPELAGEVIGAVLDAYDDGQTGDAFDPDHGAAARRVAQRAADVARSLRLTGAVPALVRCIERLSNFDAAAHAALRALERMRPEATAPLLEVFRRCPDAESRGIIAVALIEACVRDGRVRKALCGMLDENPRVAAGCLREHGDRDAIPALEATLDRLPLLPRGAAGERERCDTIVALVQAIHGLGGRVSKARAALFDAAWERGGELLLEDAGEPDPGEGGRACVP